MATLKAVDLNPSASLLNVFRSGSLWCHRRRRSCARSSRKAAVAWIEITDRGARLRLVPTAKRSKSKRRRPEMIGTERNTGLHRSALAALAAPKSGDPHRRRDPALARRAISAVRKTVGGVATILVGLVSRCR
jgi:hypothetical protein